MARPFFSGLWLYSVSSTQSFARRLFGLATLTLIMPLLSTSLMVPAFANTVTNVTHNEPDFSGTGRPPERRGRQSRGEDACPNPDQNMTPLVPQSEEGGWTTTATPTVWVHIPFSLSDTYRAKLVVKSFHFNEKGEEEDTKVASERFSLPTTSEPGVYQFALPLADESFAAIPTPSISSEAPLPGYRWTLEIFCHPNGGNPIRAEGIIRRVDMAPFVDPSVASVLQGDDPEQISSVYAHNRVWYDALTVLGEALHTEPEHDSYGEAWQRLLSYSTVGLEAIADEPLVSCCTF